MEIDFHHSVTYVCARLAGFNHKDADTIAYSSQYVDDAINSGTINFDNGAKYTRIGSAIKMNNYECFENVQSKNVLIPFHFLPGNGGLQAGAEPVGGFETKMKCTQNSFVSRDMLNACFKDRSKHYALHRLGIALNVYTDTFVNKGFSGMAHSINRAKYVEAVKLNGKDNNNKDETWKIKVKKFFKDKFDENKMEFSNDLQPIGHSAVLSYPNLPYIRWHYLQDRYDKIERRNNAKDMVHAAKYMYKILYTYKREMPFGSLKFDDIKLPEDQFAIIYENFINFDLSDRYSRHALWLKHINEEQFNFHMEEELCYKAKGTNSWKYQALGEIKDYENGNEVYKYSDDFLTSNWKLFHDALQAHRFDVVYDVLPKYGICVA